MSLQAVPVRQRKNVAIAELLKEGSLSRDQIADQLGVPRRQVDRVFERLVDEAVAAEDGSVVATRRVRKQRCPVHGLVKVWPCVACAAVALAQPPRVGVPIQGEGG